MTDSIMNVSIEDLDKVQKKMEQMISDIEGGPMLRAMRIATLLVQSKSKKNLKPWTPPGGPGRAGVDTGRMRASITPGVTSTGNTIRGVVGSNVEYAPFQEFGTKDFFGGVWIPALRYLNRALESSRDKIKELIEKALERIAKK